MNTRLIITGMSCAACASRIEKTISKLNGVKKANVNLLENSLSLDFDEKLIDISEIINSIKNIGYGAFVNQKEQSDNPREYKSLQNRVVFSFVFAIPLFYIAMGEMLKFPLHDVFLKNSIVFALTQIVLLFPIVIINFRYFKNGYKNLFGLHPNMDSLIAIGSSAAIFYGLYNFYQICIHLNNTSAVNYFRHNLYFECAGTILAVVTLGKFLEYRAKENTKSAITKLMDLSPKTATVVRNGQEQEIKTEEIKINDIILIKSGETIPTDGIITEGKCSVNEAMLTGESFPVSKSISDTVIGGTINQNGFIKIKATKIGDDTTLSQIIKLVENANSTKAPIGKTADVISSVFVPVVICISVITFTVWLLLGKSIDFALSCAISVLVISCPCALGLATPAAIMTASGKGAENGILFKNAEILEKTKSVDTVVFDKTGTITKGEPDVEEIISFNDMGKREILQIAAELEHKSKHPIAKAVLQKAKEKNLDRLNATEYEEIEGEGIKGKIENHIYTIGNKRLISENNIKTDFAEEKYNEITAMGKIPVLFCKDNILEGIIVISDTIKQSSIEAVKKLKEMSLELIMLTGDNKNTAENLAQNIGINKVIAEVLPQEKEKYIKELQSKNKKVIMVGDGINDAPALTRADIGAAIGSGSDIAIECGDIVLVKNNLIDIVNAVKISKAATQNIKQNLFWALFYNSVGIPIAAGCFSFLGLKLNPMIAALAMGCSSVFVVGNALRLKTLKLEKTFAEITAKKSKGETMKKELTIEGMMCMHCVNHVQKALSELQEVEAADVNLENKKAIITLNSQISDDLLKKTIEDLGYVLKEIKTEE